MDNLLSCPFCGSSDVLLDSVGNHWAECNQCESSGPKTDSEEDAITAWNTRHTPEGWQLVPAKADAGMKVAAWKIWDNRGDAQHQVWQAMLAAAPKWGVE